MKIIPPSFEFLDSVSSEEILRKLERAGRVCYKSEGRISDGSAAKFIGNIVRSGHESVIEHASITCKVTCDRGVTHEIVRHRIASYSQESTRYCNYSGDKFSNEITVIKPCFWAEDSEAYAVWKESMQAAEDAYMRLIAVGAKPEEARSVLPNSLKTEIVMTMNLREWRHFFRLRTSERAHPQMREIAQMMLDEFAARMPELFGDLIAPKA